MLNIPVAPLNHLHRIPGLGRHQRNIASRNRMNGAVRCDAMEFPSLARAFPSRLRVFFRLIIGPDSRRTGLSRSISRSQSSTCRRSLIFVIAGSRSIIRLSHLKHSHLMRNISPSVRMPTKPPSTSQGSHSGFTAPRNVSNSSGVNVSTGLRLVWSFSTSSASVLRSRGARGAGSGRT